VDIFVDDYLVATQPLIGGQNPGAIVWGDGTSWQHAQFSLDYIKVEATAVPEPTSLALWAGLGIMGLFAARRRKRTA